MKSEKFFFLKSVYAIFHLNEILEQKKSWKIIVMKRSEQWFFFSWGLGMGLLGKGHERTFWGWW